MTEPKEEFTSNAVLEKNLVKMEKTLVEEKDKDFIILVIGQPGSTKSSLSLLMQLALRGNVNFDDLSFKHDQYMKACKKGGKNKVIQYDEGRNSFYKRRAMQSENTEALDMLNQYRYKNHVHIINFQNLSDLELDLLYKRSHCLIRCVKQGWYHFYNKTRMQKIEIDKRNRTINWPDPNFRGSFPDPSKEYSKVWEKYKKIEQQMSQDDEDVDDDVDMSIQEVKKAERKTIASTMYEKLDITQRDVAKVFDVSTQTANKWVNS